MAKMIKKDELVCPSCQCRHLPVVFKEPLSRGYRITRKCRHCGRERTIVEKAKNPGKGV